MKSALSKTNKIQIHLAKRLLHSFIVGLIYLVFFLFTDWWDDLEICYVLKLIFAVSLIQFMHFVAFFLNKWSINVVHLANTYLMRLWISAIMLRIFYHLLQVRHMEQLKRVKLFAAEFFIVGILTDLLLQRIFNLYKIQSIFSPNV